MKANHTPGPWRITYGTEALGIQNEGALGYLALVPFTANNKPVALADARLIAASPALQAALYVTLPYIEQLADDEKLLRESLRTYKPGTLTSLIGAIRAALALSEVQ
jgi:hypothetical protein